MSMMGFQKKVWIGAVGGARSIQVFFFWMFGIVLTLGSFS